MPATELVVHVVAGIPQPSWCSRCLTSAGITVNVYAFTDRSLPTAPAGTVTRCTRCDRAGSDG